MSFSRFLIIININDEFTLTDIKEFLKTLLKFFFRRTDLVFTKADS